MISVTCVEWSTLTPESTPALAGIDLGDLAARRQAQDLADARLVSVLELRHGLQIETRSHVGTVHLGNLRLTIQPKLPGLPLLTLMRYAYGLRNLRLFDKLPQTVQAQSFQDLLIQQYAAEVAELLARGLLRHYQRRDEDLESPRGRIDFGAFARQSVLTRAALACIHHPRTEDTPVNRALLAGLGLARRLTDDPELRSRLQHLAVRLGDTVSSLQMTPDLLREAHHHGTRLTASCRPALDIAELLLGGQGTSLQHTPTAVPVRGFMFDMNRFFQALLSRFLREHLPEYEMRDEHRLQWMLSYDKQRNPNNRRAPAQRPDFVVMSGGRIAAILDAKYRDLWEQPLPREMLYQLVMYAMSGEAGGQATILYPTLHGSAQDACVDIREPLGGVRRGVVVLRPVDMMQLADLVSSQPSAARQRESSAYARRLALG